MRNLILLFTSVIVTAFSAWGTGADSVPVSDTLWPDITAVGASATVNIGITEALKQSIHEMRPDRSTHDSWPSRHTSWAFAIAGSAGFRAARYSGWWTVAAHTAANAVAMQRCCSGRHFPKDVLGGAAVGIVSVAAGEVLSRLVFRGQVPVLYTGAVPDCGAFDAVTAAVITAGGTDDIQIRTGVRSGLRYNLPLGDIWEVCAEASATCFPVYVKEKYNRMLCRGGIAVGPKARFSYKFCQFEWRLTAGVQRNISGSSVDTHQWALTYAADAAILCNISRTCAVGALAGYEGRSLGLGRNSAVLSIISRVRF